MSADIQHEGEHLDTDIENAKRCIQPTCRRVASHCSSLLDALVVFKSWFIQRQGELKSNTAGSSHSSHRLARTNEVTIYDESYSGCPGQDGSHNDLQVASNVALERDWAVARVKRAETQIARLRNACLAMRVQLEAGMRYKSEVEQVKRELELTRDTVKHYKNIIDEGNRLREDLRSELARVRKEASMARSQIASAQSHSMATPRGPNSQSTRIAPPRSKAASFDRADTLATTVLAMTSPSELDANSNSPDTGSLLYMRAQLGHYMRCCESLQEEIEQLREAVRNTTEKEVQQTQLVEAVRDKISNLIDDVCLLERRHSKRAKRLARSSLNFRWLGELAQLIRVTLPTNFATLVAEEAQTRLEDLQTSRTSPRSLSSSRTRMGKRTAHGDQVVGSPTGVSPRAKRRVVQKPSVDIDADWSADEQTSKAIRTSSKVPGDLNGTTAPCSPNAPSVEYFYSDSESSTSDLSDTSRHHRGLEEKPASLIVDNFTSLRSPTPTTDPSNTTESLIPSRTVKYPVVTTSGSPPLFDQAPSSFKTPLARPSRVKRISGCESASEASPCKPFSSCTSSPPPEHQRSHQRNNSTSSQDSTDPLMSTILVQPRSTRMLTRSQSNSSRDSSPIANSVTAEMPACESAIKPTVTRDSPIREQNVCERVPEGCDDLTNRLDTCPTSHSHHPLAPDGESVSTDTSKTLLALLEPDYPLDLIQWFDRISVSKDGADNTNSSIKKTLDSRATTLSSSVMEKPAFLYTDSAHTCVSDASSTSLETMYADYLIGGSSKPSTKLIHAVLNFSNETSLWRVLWDGLARTLRSGQTQDIQSLVEIKFVNLVYAVATENNRTDFVEKLSNHLLSNLSDFLCDPEVLARLVRVEFCLLARTLESPIHFARIFFMQLVRSLFTAHNTINSHPLKYFPLILDACIQGFPGMWHSVEPLRDITTAQLYAPVADASTYSYWIATIQALVAWQEARYDRDNYSRGNENQEALFIRLHNHGWLPGSRTKHPETGRSTITSCTLSQHTYRLRCLVLRLIDACLHVKRERNFDIPLVMESVALSSSHITEAACSLMVLISAMAFVVGEDAIIDNQDDISPDMPADLNSGSRGITHQRKRRHRQNRRQQRLGLLGWLLTGRLLPWFCKCFKTLKDDDTTPPGNLIVDRLALLITDLIVLGGYLFHRTARPTRGSDTEELRTVVFDSGRRMVHILQHDPMACRYMSPQTRRICLIRLFPFDPTQVLQALVDSATDVVDWVQVSSVLNPTSTLLWPEVPPKELVQQVLTLLERVVPKLPNTLVQRYKDMCRSWIT